MLYIKRLDPSKDNNFDEVIEPLYNKLVEEDLLRVYFYDGSVKDLDDLYSWAYNFPIIYLCYNDEALLAMCAFGTVTSNLLSAFGHFCIFKAGRNNIESAAACLVQAMEELSRYGTKTVIGITPSKYRHAIRFIQERLFFEVMYVVPDMINLHYKNNKTCDGVLSIYRLGTGISGEKIMGAES